MLHVPSVYRMRGDMLVRNTTPDALPYLKHLSKQESFALGWIPLQIYERVWSGTFTGWIILCEVNMSPVGFCFAAPASHPSKAGRIYQLAVQSDARRFDYGTFLADVAEELCRSVFTKAISCRCATELPSNTFWQMLGYRKVNTVGIGASVGDSPRQVRRPLNLYLKELEGFGSILPSTERAVVETQRRLSQVVMPMTERAT